VPAFWAKAAGAVKHKQNVTSTNIALETRTSRAQFTPLVLFMLSTPFQTNSSVCPVLENQSETSMPIEMAEPFFSNIRIGPELNMQCESSAHPALLIN
jgi:hypothetical protein